MSTKALLIGINYCGTRSELSGCINDVKNMKKYLLKNYKIDNMQILTDYTPRKPTKRNIIRKLMWLIRDVKAGDSLFLHYSGHGSNTYDLDGDENDGHDETLVPLDYQSKGMITDDWLRENLIYKLPSGVRLFCVLDCCHSATLMDLRYKYDIYRKYYNTNRNPKYKKPLGSIITVSGSLDSQTSADSVFLKEEYQKGQEYEAQGALTHHFLKLQKKNYNYKDFIYHLQQNLKNNGYSQKPKLCSGKLMDLNEKCVLLLSKNRDISCKCENCKCIDGCSDNCVCDDKCQCNNNVILEISSNMPEKKCNTKLNTKCILY